MAHGSLRRPAARGSASHAFQEQQVRGGTCDTILLLCVPVVSAVEGLAEGCSRAARGARAWVTTDMNTHSRYCIRQIQQNTTTTDRYYGVIEKSS